MLNSTRRQTDWFSDLSTQNPEYSTWGTVGTQNQSPRDIAQIGYFDHYYYCYHYMNIIIFFEIFSNEREEKKSLRCLLESKLNASSQFHTANNEYFTPSERVQRTGHHCQVLIQIQAIRIRKTHIVLAATTLRYIPRHLNPIETCYFDDKTG